MVLPETNSEKDTLIGGHLRIIRRERQGTNNHKLKYQVAFPGLHSVSDASRPHQNRN